MNPEQESPYWDRIVGNDWPEVSPAAWNGLETKARDAADALNTGDTTQAAQGFDDTVRSSEALQPMRAAMSALRQRPQDFADALYATADTFGDFAELARRTRNQILDTVADATARIQRETRGDNNDDGVTDDEAEAETDAATTDSILEHARAEVVDIVAAALASVSPQGLPSLDDIATALGQPGPWTIQTPIPDVPRSTPVSYDDPAAPGHDDRTGGPAPDPGSPESAPGGRSPDRVQNPMPPSLGDRPAEPGSSAETDRPASLDDESGPPGQQVTPTEQVPGPPSGPLQTSSPAYTDSAAGASTRPAANHSEPADDTTDSGSPGRDGRGDENTAAAGRDRKAATEPTSDSANTGSESTDIAPEPSAIAAPDIADPAPAGTPVFLPPLAGGTAPASTSPTTATPSRVHPAVVPPVEAPRVQPAAAVKAPGTAGAIPQSAATAAPAGRSVPGPRDAAPTQRSDAEPESAKGSDELVKNAVGAAVAAAATPAFVVGEKFDGDSALARTLLSGIRAVADPETIGVDWAVSVMRHQNGVSAFVSSNEGRGWLPAGLYLPREVSTPWQWSVSEHAGWEGVSDPARVLAEFALAWGGRSGAVLSALASSLPIDAGLRAQLREVSMSGSVPASTHMDLSSPAAGLLDRLGIAGSPRMIERAAAVPDGSLAVRCLELAVDAHMRVDKAGFAAMNSVGAPDIRLRILRAVRQRREFPDSWWEELREVDDLLAASVLTQRIDAARVKLGELRPGHAGESAESGTAAVRELTFQRRCNELVLLLAQTATRQILRDAVYVHAQILSHPLFGRPSAESGGGPPATVSTHGPR